MSQMEIGIECTCGYKRRAIKLSDQTRNDALEIQAYHLFQIHNEVTDTKHVQSLGLLATSDWPAISIDERTIGAAWIAGVAYGTETERSRITQLIAIAKGL